MSLIPDSLRYTKEHEWVQESSATVIRMGITDYAQGALGDIVYVQLPKIGDVVVADKVCGEVESTKSVSEIFSPVSGTVVAINESLEAHPEVLNSDPYGAGWLAEIEVSAQPEGLLSADGYRQITA
ncbi:MAG: glycine cleavage system protein GcvH [Candidatus Planktophila sp.]|jgi:glycine cleavage system H protein|nr:glycine cleavage system protein GcvH [Candidatus Planktophila sp.]